MEAAKKGTSFMLKKILFAVVALVAVGAVTGGIVFLVSKAANEKPEDKYVEEESEESEEEEEIAEVVIEPEEESMPSDTEPSVSEETTKKDISQYFNPDADLLSGPIIFHGNEITLPCTVGDLKAMGFTTDGVVYDGSLYMDYMYIYTEVDEEYGDVYEEEREFSFEFFVEGPDYKADGVPDDAVVYGFTTSSILYGDFQIGEIDGDITESEFLALAGTPAYAKLTPDQFMISDHIYLDENNNAYRFEFCQYIDSDEEPILLEVYAGTPEYWQEWTIMEG